MKRFGWIRGVLLGLGLVGGLTAPGSGESPAGKSLVQLREVTVEPREGGLWVQIKTSGPAAYQASLIDTPTRLVIDLESTGYGWRKTPLIVATAPLRQIRGSQFKKGIARVVLELTRKVGYRVEQGPEGLTVVLGPSSTPGAPKKAEGLSTRMAKAEPMAPEVKPEARRQPVVGLLPPETLAAAPQPLAGGPQPPAGGPPAPIRLAQAARVQAASNASRLISLDFKDADIANLLRILAAESGRNIVAGEDVKGKVSISLQNVSWELALDTILEARGLQKIEKDNVIRVVSTEQLTKEREAKAKAEEAKMKGEAEVRTKLAEAEVKEAEARQRKLASEAAIAEAQARGPLKEETIRLNYADPDDVVATLEGILGLVKGAAAPAARIPLSQPGVTPSIGLGGAPPIAEQPFSQLYGPQAGAAPAPAAVSPSAEVLAKGITIRAHKPTNTIFIRHYAADLERIKKLIRETLDVPLPQVKIEARMEILDRPSLLEIGVQWGGGLAQREGRNVLVGQGFGASTDASRATGIGTTDVLAARANPNLTLANLLPVAAATGLPTGANLVNLPFTGGSSGYSPAGGISFGIVGTRFNLNLALQALERLQKTKTLARPEIVTVENKSAQMSLGEEIPYQTVSSAGTQVQFKEAVMKLEVTPTVIREGNAVNRIKMKVVVENNSQTGQLVGGVPVIAKRRAETEVMVKEGEILVIGGVTQRAATETISKVPLLGDIPLLGWLFKRRLQDITPDREMVVFITPSIVKGGSPIPATKPPADKPKGS